MECQHWPCPGNNPTIGITLDYQTLPERDTTVADLVWNEGPVKTHHDYGRRHQRGKFQQQG
eukprot:1993918-Karenia_brevis.AAC.1